MNYLQRLMAARRIQKRITRKDETKEGTYSPRKLYRGLTVPYSNAPGRKRIKPKQAGREERK